MLDIPAPDSTDHGVPLRAICKGLHLVMQKDKSVLPDCAGVFNPYPSFDACVKKVAELLIGTEIGYYQYVTTHEKYVSVETILTHSEGEQLPTGAITIPIGKNDALSIAIALGWAKRLSLVHAFSLGTAELPPEEQQEIQNQKPVKSEARTLDKLEL